MSAKRTSNFSDADRLLLIKIANLYKSVIECKKTDAVTWKEKEEMWKQVENKFNSSTTGPPRTAKQLKTKYEAVKKEMKKEFSRHRTYVTGTGGGSYICPPTPKTEEEKILAETISISIQGFQNNFDSDGFADGIACNSQMFDNVEVEKENAPVDWTLPNTKLLRTPVNQILRPPLDTNENEIEYDIIYEDTVNILSPEDTVEENVLSVDHCYPKTQEDEVNKDKQPSKSKSWSSRRRPVLTKKKCLSSAGAKFEKLAEQKTELVALERKIAEEQLIQNKKEHEERMKILDLKRKREELELDIASNIANHTQCNHLKRLILSSCNECSQ